MAFLGRCHGCRAGNHESHEQYFDTPPPSAGFVCGGGHCVCYECEPGLAHLDYSNPDRGEPSPEPIKTT